MIRLFSLCFETHRAGCFISSWAPQRRLSQDWGDWSVVLSDAEVVFFSVALQRIFFCTYFALLLRHVSFFFLLLFLIKQACKALASGNCWDFFFCIIWCENMLVQDTTMEWIKHVILHSWLSLCGFYYMKIKWIVAKNDWGWSLSLQFDTFRPFPTPMSSPKIIY